MSHVDMLAQYCGVLLVKICEHWLLKSVLSVLFVISTFIFDPSMHTELWALLALIVMDTFTALIAATKNNIPIESRKVFKSAVKTVVYFLLVAAGYVTEYVIPIPYIDQIVIGFLALTELVSIIENFGKCGYSVPTHLLAQLKKLKNEK